MSRATFFGDTDDASFNLEGFGGLVSGMRQILAEMQTYEKTAAG
ncbi:hypothetical protein [Bradyrhizobium sp. USDA 223]